MTENFENLISEASGKNWTLILESNSGLDDLLDFNECVNVNEVEGVYSEYKNLITDGQWNYYLSNLGVGHYMFQRLNNLSSFNVNLPSLTNGTQMFYQTNLESFNSDLSKLIYGNTMFRDCTKLTIFDSDLSSLIKGAGMFYNCNNLTSFNSNLSSLTDGFGMFYQTNLESFNSDLSNLTNGFGMFGNCENLTSFNSDLSSLTKGDDMFHSCKLDAISVKNITDSIPHNESSAITIGTNIINDSTTLEAQKLEYAQTCNCESWEELNNIFSDKGWTVAWQFNGTSASNANTLNLLDGNNISTSLWAKLEEVTDKDIYGYTSEDGSKFYNIHWYHESNGDNKGYQFFGSLLEACGYFGVVPKQ